MPLKIIIRFIKNNKTPFGVALLGGIAGSICTIIISLSLGNYYQLFFHHSGSKTTILHLLGLQATGSLKTFFWVYGALLFIKVVSDWMFYYFSKTSAIKLITQTRNALFTKDVYGKHKNEMFSGSGKKIVKYSSDMQSIQNLYTKGILTFIKDVCLLAIGFSFLLKINSTLSLIMLAAFPVLMGINYFFTRNLETLNSLKRNSQSNLMTFVNNSFQAADTVKAFRKETTEIKRFSKLSEQLRSVQSKYYYNFAYIQALVPVLLYAITGMILFLVANHQISVKDTDLMAFVLISILQFSALRRVVKVETIWRAGLLSLKKISDQLSVNELTISEQPKIVRFKSIRFENFNLNEAIQNDSEIQIHIKPGIMNHVSCSNCDNLIGVLTGEHLNFSGNIFINKKPIQQYTKSSLYQLFSIASGRYPLLGNTIQEMVNRSKKTGSKYYTNQILIGLGWDLIEPKIDLQQGFNTKNDELTQAHRKLLLIARAVLNKTPIIILDKPFYGLKESVAEHCLQYFQSLLPKRTIIFLSDSSIIPFIKLDFQETLEGKAG